MHACTQVPRTTRMQESQRKGCQYLDPGTKGRGSGEGGGNEQWDSYCSGSPSLRRSCVSPSSPCHADLFARFASDLGLERDSHTRSHTRSDSERAKERQRGLCEKLPAPWVPLPSQIIPCSDTHASVEGDNKEVAWFTSTPDGGAFLRLTAPQATAPSLLVSNPFDRNVQSRVVWRVTLHVSRAATYSSFWQGRGHICQVS
ncbi:uncharacterized protein B0I36DRAFT_322285 [Microdochium trichocladiopsis]|uniref:Uncharacterized protein n=1 Tax=Microdochium trichocladiopsis TaxID=1682393 RepID=A0A9P8Y667_9PEZI|nr:uncharacterized protein B0I36DRAFT_322285 [Microdochium trichocladiopsis]KAH7030702.1 hypothetical protein B0I36DRAFT_322285 [Microdochium trichocladiopsis]